jgi:hypothetical protein
MSYYNYNNAKLELASYAGGSWGAAVPIYAENLTISLTSNLKAIDLLPNRSSFSYTAGGGINGSLSLGYYLTGEDFLANFMESDNLISGNFAGLSFSSGALTSYSFEAVPFGPVMVSTSINFYGGIRGRFTPTRETLDADLLTYTDCKFTQISGVTPHENGETEEVKASTSVSFGFASNVQPVYTVGDAVPRELRFNKKTIDASINGYALPSWDEGIGDFTSDTEQQNYLNDKFFSGIAKGELLIGLSSSNDNAEWPYYSSDFSADHDGWNNSNTTISRRDGYGEDDILEVFGNTSNNYHYIYRTAFEPGKSYRVKGKIRVNESHDITNVMVHDEDGINYAVGSDTIPGLSVEISTRGEWVEFESDICTPKTQYLFFYGRKASAYTYAGTVSDQFVVKDIQTIPATIQSYKVRGALKAHNINVTAGEKITTTLSLSQEKYQNAPAITSFTPTAGVVGATITILGTDLENVTEVTFGDEKRVYTHFTTHNSSTIVTTIPDEAITCRVGLKSPGGDAKLGAATNYGDGMPGIFTVQDGGF